VRDKKGQEGTRRDREGQGGTRRDNEGQGQGQTRGIKLTDYSGLAAQNGNLISISLDDTVKVSNIREGTYHAGMFFFNLNRPRTDTNFLFNSNR
jgi:hypothetical protein